ncbi:MAG: aminotransferase class I/II-fold pyridoxal phosphate-dependent enzyme [Lachnospiraceae bacterium]|nr:aminotransferase class I/II-fold pyridoxal phosphate-dependent enzyme [Lachnospiraceae bacterium]
MEIKRNKKFLEPWQIIAVLLGAYDFIAFHIAYFAALLLRHDLKYHAIDYEYIVAYKQSVTIAAAVCVLIFALFRMYRIMWRFASYTELVRIILGSLLAGVLYSIGITFLWRMPFSFYIGGTLLLVFFAVVPRYAYRIILVLQHNLKKNDKNLEHVMIIGAGSAGQMILKEIQSGEELKEKAVCFVDDNPNKWNRSIEGVPIIGGRDSILNGIKKYDVKKVYIALPTATAERRKEIVDICKETDCNIMQLPGLYQLALGEVSVGAMKPVEIDEMGFSPPDIGADEIDEVVDALRSGWITTGPRVKRLERRLAAYIATGRNDVIVDGETEKPKWDNKVVCLNSATAAEELNLRILGVGPGDEVIVPAYTYTASASAAIHCGATVKFVDIQKDGDFETKMPEMDYDALEKAITPATKAVITVDLAGIVCDYERVFKIAERKKNLFTPMESDGTRLSDLSSRIQKAIGRVAVVADCAHSLGGSRVIGKERLNCGAIADFSSFSFHAVKNFTTAEGGASVWRPIEGISDEEIYKMYQLLSLHGQNKDALAKTKAGSWEYDIVGPWYKCNMTDIMAAIGLRQLDRYPGLLERRVEIIAKYDAVCDELGISHLNHHTNTVSSSNHLYLIRIPNANEDMRNEIIRKLAECGVASNVHYKPLPMMSAYKAMGFDIKDYPNAYDYYHNLISLPLHTLLTDRNVDYICGVLRQIFSEYM